MARILEFRKILAPPGALQRRLEFARAATKLSEQPGAPAAEELMALVKRTSGEDDVAQWCRARLLPELVELVARSLWRAQGASALTDAQLRELALLFGPRPMPLVQALLQLMATLGADDGALVAALGRLTPLVEPADQSVLRVLATPARLATWLAVTSVRADFSANLGQYMVFLWLTDQGADARAVLGALIQGGPGAPAKPTPIFALLVLLGGSDTAATAFLSAHGVKENELAQWGWNEKMRALPQALGMLSKLRPPGAAADLLRE